MKQFIALLFIFTIWIPLQAQSLDTVYHQVYFDFDKADLTAESEVTLEAIFKIKTLQSITLEANTDARGSNQYNIELGARRANAVQRFLIEKGILQNVISIQNYGEEKPLVLTTSEKDMAKNRRVDIRVIYKNEATISQKIPLKPKKLFKDEITIQEEKNATTLIKEAFTPQPEFFKINNEEDVTLVTRSGSIIRIEANTFEFDGDKNDLKLEVKEALTFKQMLQNNVTTLTENGQVLQTGGMISIEATYKDQPLEPKKDVVIQIPAVEVDKEMKVYTGVTVANPENTNTDKNSDFHQDNEVIWTADEGKERTIQLGFWGTEVGNRDNWTCCRIDCLNRFKVSKRKEKRLKRYRKKKYAEYKEKLALEYEEMVARCEKIRMEELKKQESRKNAKEVLMPNAAPEKVPAYYTIRTKKLRWINIDKMPWNQNNPTLVTLRPRTPKYPKITYYFISKRAKFLINGQQFRNVKVPRNEEIIVLGMGFDENDAPIMAYQVINANKRLFDIEFKKATSLEIQDKLNSL